MSSLLAQSGHGLMSVRCLLLGVKRTFLQVASMSVIDPNRTLAGRSTTVPELTPIHFPVCYFELARCLVLSLGGGNETAR
jgi:hypothetical protein